MEKNHLYALLFILAFTVLFKLYYINSFPLSEDEVLYAEMIEEQVKDPSLLPTYFGYLAIWKPGLYFFIYSLFLPLTKAAFPLSFELIYRFPNVIFLLISTYLVYLIGKRFWGGDVGILSAVAFSCSPIAVHVESRLLIEAFIMPLILAGVYLYTKENKSRLEYALAGVFAFLAALAKYVFAMLVPICALVYAYTSDRKKLKDPLFLLSLVGAPLGILVFYLALNSIGLGNEIFMSDAGRGVSYGGEALMFYTLKNFSWVFGFIFLYLAALFAIAMKKDRPKVEPFIWVWIAVCLLAIISSTYRQWYAYYMIPPLSLIAGRAMVEKDKADSLSLLFAVVFVSVNLLSFTLSFEQWQDSIYVPLYQAKDAGLSIVGDNSTLFVGKHYSMSIALCYKALEERRLYGEPVQDFGYVLVRQVQLQNGTWVDPWKISKEEWDKYLMAFIQDYNTTNYTVEEVKFHQYFWNETTFRRKTNLTEFNTIVTSPPMNASIPGYSAVFTGQEIAVYKRQAGGTSPLLPLTNPP